MSSLQDLALIVLNYNSAGDTIFCVEKLLSFGSDFHIIVVDNVSTDDSFAVLTERLGEREYVDVLQSNRNGGYSYGNNFGMKYAMDEYGSTVLGILNPDVIIPRLEVLSNMKSYLESDDSFAVIGGAMVDADRTYDPRRSGFDIPSAKTVALYQFIKFRKRQWKSQVPMVGETLAQVGCVSGCFFLTKACVMQEIGFLDENVFLYREEELLGIELQRRGYKEVVAFDQFYIHNHVHVRHQKMPFRKKINLTRNEYRSHRYLIRKYYSAMQLPILWFVEVLNKVYLAAGYVVNQFIGNEAITNKDVHPTVKWGGWSRRVSRDGRIFLVPRMVSDKEAMAA